MRETTAADTIGVDVSGLHSHGPDPAQGIEIEIERATSRPVTTVEAEAVVPYEEIDHHTLAVHLVEK